MHTHVLVFYKFRMLVLPRHIVTFSFGITRRLSAWVYLRHPPPLNLHRYLCADYAADYYCFDLGTAVVRGH